MAKLGVYRRHWLRSPLRRSRRYVYRGVFTPSAPPTPTGLGLLPGAPGMAVSWSRIPNFADYAPGDLSYNLDRSLNGADWDFLDFVVDPTISFLDDTTDYGVEYFYRVTASSAIYGDSLASAEQHATAIGPNGIPGNPLIPPVLSFVYSTASEIRISWTAATGGTDPKDYGVYRDGSLLVDGQTSPFDDSTAETGSLYTYQIVATDADNSTVQSNEITAALPFDGTGGGGGGSGDAEGTGEVAIDHDGGAGVTVDGADSDADILRYVKPGTGSGVNGMLVSAYLASEYNSYPPIRRAVAVTRTDSNGRWVAPINLDSGLYVIVADVNGDKYKPRVNIVEVP